MTNRKHIRGECWNRLGDVVRGTFWGHRGGNAVGGCLTAAPPMRGAHEEAPGAHRPRAPFACGEGIECDCGLLTSQRDLSIRLTQKLGGGKNGQVSEELPINRKNLPF